MANLTDTEIKTILRSYGCDCGPITPQTRNVYMKKIIKLQENQTDRMQSKKIPRFEPNNGSIITKQDSYDTDMNLIAEDSRRKALTSQIVSPISYTSKNFNRRMEIAAQRSPPQANASNVVDSKWYRGSLRTISNYMGAKDNGLLDISDADLSDTESSLFTRLRKNYFKKTAPRENVSPHTPLSSYKSLTNHLWKFASLDRSHMPNILLVLVIVLISVVFGCYLTLKTRYTPSELDLTMERFVNKGFYSAADMKSLRPYLQRLYGVLSVHAGHSICQGNTDRRMPFMTAREHLSFGLKHAQLSPISDNNWSLLMKLVMSLPADKLHLVAYDNNEAILDGSRLAEEVTYLECLRPRRSLWCRSKLAVLGVLSWLWYMVVAVIVVMLLLLGLYGLFLYRQRQTEANERSNAELNDILATLSEILKEQLRRSEATANIESHISLEKLRIMLQQTYPRLRENELWKKVKEYTFRHEPSILMREILSQGATLQWRGRPDWQGSAVHSGKEVSFEKGPTECLKVRNIVVDRADWEEYLHKELSARLHGAGEIKHIGFIKKGSTIIAYVMCASKNVAGKAFAKMNANYYNGHLLGVKFIRLDKYVQRFPGAIEFI